MYKKKGFRFLSAMMLCLVLMCCFSVSAFAYADDTDQELPITEATQPEEAPVVKPETVTGGEPIADEGNAYTRDLLYDKATNKQFITVQTKNGNTFFIVIDYDAPVNEEEEQYQTYFLNMVDDSDLLALLDEDTVSGLTTCSCTEKCVAGAVNTECPVCKNDMSECRGKSSAPETPVQDESPEQPDEKQPEKSSNLVMIVVVIAIAGIGGAAYYYFRFVRGKKQPDEDLDFFDDEGYEEEAYINEDKEPDIAADDEDSSSTSEDEEE